MKTQVPIYQLLMLILLFNISCDTNDEILNQNQNQNQNSNANPVILPENKLLQVAINTNGETIIDEPKINAYIAFSKEDIISYEGNIGIEIRGASSQMFPKKSFGFETRDENDEDFDVSLLGFPEEEDWILYAPYSDKSLIRNVLIYDLSREMGRYASRTELVELTINDEYKGVYVFMEKLKRDSERIAINKLKEDENSGEDLTGGYILKIDKTAGSNLGNGYNNLNSFTSQFSPNHSTIGQEINFLYEYPKADNITQEQKDYISSYVKSFETALNSGTNYTEYIDVDSFIDFFLLNELSNNVDGYRLSTYLVKDKNEKLKMGPIWDFNLAFGNASYCQGGFINVWAYRFNERCSDDIWQVPFWWEKLLEDPIFTAKLKSRWSELRASTFSDSNILGKVNAYSEMLKKSGAITDNFATWDILGMFVWPNRYAGETYDDEVKYLGSWTQNRLSWLDDAIGDL